MTDADRIRHGGWVDAHRELVAAARDLVARSRESCQTAWLKIESTRELVAEARSR